MRSEGIARSEYQRDSKSAIRSSVDKRIIKGRPFVEQFWSFASRPTTKSVLRNDAKYIGLDVHQGTISAAVQDAASELVMKTKAETICSSFAACAAVCM